MTSWTCRPGKPTRRPSDPRDPLCETHAFVRRVVVAVWTVNLAASTLWLRRFRQGPLEWLWRGLVRGELEPLRLPAAAHSRR